MTAAVIDPQQFVDKKVLISFDGDGDKPAEADVEATLEAGNEKAVLIKRKGKASVEFIDTVRVTKLELAPTAEPTISARRQDPVSIDNIKRHLVDRHGYAVADINAMKATDAFTFHDSIDHAPLGHFHAVKPEKTEG